MTTTLHLKFGTGLFGLIRKGQQYTMNKFNHLQTHLVNGFPLIASEHDIAVIHKLSHNTCRDQSFLMNYCTQSAL